MDNIDSDNAGRFINALLNVYSSTLSLERQEIISQEEKEAERDYLEDEVKGVVEGIVKGSSIADEEARQLQYFVIGYAEAAPDMKNLMNEYLETEFGIDADHIFDERISHISNGIEKGIINYEEGEIEALYEKMRQVVDEDDIEQTSPEETLSPAQKAQKEITDSSDVLSGNKSDRTNYEKPITYYPKMTLEGQVEMAYRLMIDGWTRKEVARAFNIKENRIKHVLDHWSVIQTIEELTGFGNAAQFKLSGKGGDYKAQLEDLKSFSEMKDDMERILPDQKEPFHGEI